MKQILADIQDGTFAREWITENHEGRPRFRPLREEARSSQIHEVGRGLRAMMPWLDPKEV
jgi:ketol-acid reductoisomerase